MRGRPLAFLTLVVVGWATARIVLLLPEAVVRPLTLASREALIPQAEAETTGPVAMGPTLPPGVQPLWRATFATAPSRALGGRSTEMARPIPVSLAQTRASAVANTPVPREFARPIPTPPGLAPTPPIDRPGRWSGSAWAIARDGDGGGGALLSPLLGGSQAGVRIAYRLDDADRFALFARAAAPFRHGPAELAAGAQWRPGRVPVTFYAEARAMRGRVAPAAGVFGGGAIALPADFRLEGYGQVGVIRRDGVSGFGDGQVRLVRPFGRVEVGAGAWGAAQRGASRLDVGPSLALPIAATPVSLRVTLDWRHRIVGNARPASGPVLSLGADF